LNWLVFLAVLLAPPLLAALSVLLFDKKGDLAPTVAMLGGGLAGIITGAMLGRRIGSSSSTRIALGILFAFIMAVVCIGMSCLGCVVSGYELNLH